MATQTEVKSITKRICGWCEKEYKQNESDSLAPELYCSACCENGGGVHHTETPELNIMEVTNGRRSKN